MNRRHGCLLDLPGRPGVSRGFTLVELLIALTLIGLLSVVLLGGLRFGTRVWETGHERSAASAEIEGLHGLLRRQLSQARLPAQGPGAPADTASFVGTSERVRFTAPLPDYVGVGGLYRFELAPVERGEGAALELAWQLYRPDRSEWFEEETLSRRILIEGVERLRVRYFGTSEAGEEPQWHDSWDSPGALPALIALELEFPADDARAWPNLTIAPHAAKALGP